MQLIDIVVLFVVFLCSPMLCLTAVIIFFHYDVPQMRIRTPMRTEHIFVIWSCIKTIME